MISIFLSMSYSFIMHYELYNAYYATVALYKGISIREYS